MKNTIKLVTILTTLILSGATLAGTFEGGGGPSSRTFEGGGGPSTYSYVQEFGRVKELPTRQLNLVLRNNTYKANVSKHPSPKIKLFNACINGKHIETISKSPQAQCLDWFEERTYKGEDEVKTLTCRRWSKPMSAKYAKRYVKNNSKNCSLIKGSEHPNQSLYGNQPNDMVPYCEFKVSAKNFSRTQNLEIHQLRDFSSSRIYMTPKDNDVAVPGYSRYKYVVPNCVK